MKNMFHKTGILLTACLCSLTLLAAENEAVPAIETESTDDEFLTEPLDEASRESEEESREVAQDENFVPTIRITEDLPVAFPVDI